VAVQPERGGAQASGKRGQGPCEGKDERQPARFATGSASAPVSAASTRWEVASFLVAVADDYEKALRETDRLRQDLASMEACSTSTASTRKRCAPR